MKSKIDVTQQLAMALQSREYFVAEEIAAELGVEIDNIHRAILKLRVQPGWSITAQNSVAYGRRKVYGDHTASNRWRKKPKTSSDYDPNEPEWTPTVFKVKHP